MGRIRDADPATLSPYLAQHRDNPVDWFEWGPDAEAAAQSSQKPILLSVGYASCHWCHVMAHESFEDAETAELMNQWFVSVKVDREERPDVDRIYMDAVQAMTGHGGWPMTVFLTPTGVPFYAGTYYPKEPRGQMPSFREVLAAVAQTWESRREEVEQQATRLVETIDQAIPPGPGLPGMLEAQTAVGRLERSYDKAHGGFGAAPKFPQEPVLELLARLAALPGSSGGPLRMLDHTLHRMAAGGIYDRLGGGFARYSTDERWLVPHFEKMLYNNAMLARLYLRGWQLIGSERLREVAEETLEYMLRDLGLPGGGFASGEDADSEGREGAFYVFGWDELTAAAGDDTELVAAVLGARPEGNWEGANVLSEARSPDDVAVDRGLGAQEVREAVSRVEDRLLEVRAQRPRPGLDDKVVTAWNGLALRALAEAGAILHEERYLEAATRNARFLLSEMVVDGRLMRSWRGGAASVPGFADDYASLVVGLLTLYQATADEQWLHPAFELADEMVRLFWDEDAGGLYMNGADADSLIRRPKDLQDNPVPSATSLGAEAFTMIAALTGDPRMFEMRDKSLRAGGRIAAAYPSAAGHLLAVAATAEHMKEVAVVAANGSADHLADVVWEEFRPDCVMAFGPGDSELIPLLAGRTPLDGEAAAYVCRNFACDAPVTDATSLRRRLADGH